MTTVINKEIEDAHDAWLNEAIDWGLKGTPILRKNTYPYIADTTYSDIIAFAAGYNAAKPQEAKLQLYI